MKTYHHIEYYGKYLNQHVIAFDKLDGSNIRIEYSKKRGFYKYGTRKTMFDEKSEPFGFVINLFKQKYETSLTKIFKSDKYKKIESFVCFFEVFGKDSAFGQHDFINDKFDIVLIDVDQYKKGMIPAKEFIEDFQHVGIPKVIYEGTLTKEFINQIKDNCDLVEGVVCKGILKTKKGVKQTFCCKIKTDKWLERLKRKDLDLYNEEMKDYENEIEEDELMW